MDLFPEDVRAKASAARTRTVAEVLVESEVQVPVLTGRTIVVQPHCHQYSVMGYAADLKVLERTGEPICLVDGYSCRAQAVDLTNVQGVTLSQLLTRMPVGPEYSARAKKLQEAASV